MEVVVEGDGPLDSSVDQDGRFVVKLANFSGCLTLPLGVTIGQHQPRKVDDECLAICTNPGPKLLPDKLPVGRRGATLTAVGKNYMILYGGEDQDGNLLGDMHKLSLDKYKWTSLSVCKGRPIVWHTATFLESSGHVLVFGGNCEDGESNTAMVFDCDINLWYPLTTSGRRPTARMGHSACLVQGGLCIFGGRIGRRDLNDLFLLDTKTWRWTSPPKIGGKPPKQRAFHSATSICNGKEMVVVGGLAGKSKAFDDVHLLNLETFTWSSPVVTGVLFRPRCHHRCEKMLSDDKLVVFGGTKGDTTYDDAYILDVEKSHWSRAENFDKLGAVSGHSSAVYDRPGLGRTLVSFSSKLCVVPLFKLPEQPTSPVFDRQTADSSVTPTNKLASVSTSCTKRKLYSSASSSGRKRTFAPVPLLEL
mmetsp:Transcript_12673/g.20498  ORF Transcript_12673/g.20498 Transcript_12673/m.20498 type:complete len:419 (+) Transcript_12673:135-1391(+)